METARIIAPDCEEEGRGDTERDCVALFGMPLARTTSAGLVDTVFARLASGAGGWIVTANLDHLRRHAVDPEIRALSDGADWIVADGMPLVWASRLANDPLPERVAGSDLVWRFAERAAREGRSLYLLGGAPGAAEAAAERLLEHAPGLRIAGLSSPVVSSTPTESELDSIRDQLREAQPDLVYCAFGAPKQERVIAALRRDFPATWWMGVGISLSFIAGQVDRAPAWMQKTGLEWLHRLVQEPGRLARRYLLEDLPFALRLALHALAQRR